MRLRVLRRAHPHEAGGRTLFFIPRSSLVRDAFFLAYGGLHWEYAEVAKLPIRTRQEFVDALERQLDFERQETGQAQEMNDLGLGIIVSLKDAFTQNASRVQSSMQTLDASVEAAGANMTRNLGLIEKGTMMIGAGLALLAIPTGLVASTAATQKALGELASVGVKDFRAMEDAAESFTNTLGRHEQSRVHQLPLTT